MTNLLLKIFVKNYKDVGNAAVRDRVGNLSSGVGIFLNLLLSAAKITVGVLFGLVSVRKQRRIACEHTPCVPSRGQGAPLRTPQGGIRRKYDSGVLGVGCVSRTRFGRRKQNNLRF